MQIANDASLDKLMLWSINEENNELFKAYVKKFISFRDVFVSKRNVVFKLYGELKAIFGESDVDEPQDVKNYPFPNKKRPN